MDHDEEHKRSVRARDPEGAAPAGEDYERPQVVDYGTLRELTLTGTAPLSDSFGGAAGGGS